MSRVVITGGASGIGARMAERFAEAGNEVVVCDASAEAVTEFAARNPGIRAVQAHGRVVPTRVDGPDHLDGIEHQDHLFARAGRLRGGNSQFGVRESGPIGHFQNTQSIDSPQVGDRGNGQL